MGYRVSWVAVKGKAEAEVLDELSLVKTDEITDPFDSGDYECATLSNGWFLVTVNEYDDRIVAKNILEKLSLACEVIAVIAEETVMDTRAQMYKNGELLWSVSHESEEDIRHLEVVGELPERYNDIVAQMELKQSEENGADYYFSIPNLLAKSYVGFAYDESIDATFFMVEY